MFVPWIRYDSCAHSVSHVNPINIALWADCIQCFPRTGTRKAKKASHLCGCLAGERTASRQLLVHCYFVCQMIWYWLMCKSILQRHTKYLAKTHKHPSGWVYRNFANDQRRKYDAAKNSFFLFSYTWLTTTTQHHSSCVVLFCACLHSGMMQSEKRSPLSVNTNIEWQNAITAINR